MLPKWYYLCVTQICEIVLAAKRPLTIDALWVFENMAAMSYHPRMSFIHVLDLTHNKKFKNCSPGSTFTCMLLPCGSSLCCLTWVAASVTVAWALEARRVRVDLYRVREEVPLIRVTCRLCGSASPAGKLGLRAAWQCVACGPRGSASPAGWPAGRVAVLRLRASLASRPLECLQSFIEMIQHLGCF